MSKKYVGFLDVDGVLASARVQMGQTCVGHMMWDKFDAVAVDFLNRLDSAYDMDWVLMSTWKQGLKYNDPTVYHWVSAAFRNSGFTGYFPYPFWKTDPLNTNNYGSQFGDKSRAGEVRDYLLEYGEHYEDYILFDDSAYDFNKVLPSKRFVKTSPEDGMLMKHMLHALSIVGQWEKKK